MWKAAFSTSTNCFYLLPAKQNNKSISVIHKDSAKDKKMQEVESIPLPSIAGTCKQFIVSNSGNILACIIGRNLFYANLQEKAPVKLINLENEVTLISLAISPNDSIIATGDIVGKLCCWLLEEKNLPTKSTYHWHAHAIECLTYNPEGNILYSGGHEGVLVMWHNNTNSHSYLPRLAAQLQSLNSSSDGTLLAVGLSNNTIKIIK